MIGFDFETGERSVIWWARSGAPLSALLMVACVNPSRRVASPQHVSADPSIGQGSIERQSRSPEPRRSVADRRATRAWRSEHVELEFNQICFDLQLPEEFKIDAFDFPYPEEDEELVVFLRGPRYTIAMGTELVYDLARSFASMQDHFAKQASNEQFVRAEETPFLWVLVFAQKETYTVMAWWPERKISCFANNLRRGSDADEVVDICWTAYQTECKADDSTG